MLVVRPLVVLAVTLATARPAAATPLLDPHVGGPVFTGPTSPHVSAIYWNPAAAGLMSGFHVLLQTGVRLDQIGVDRATISSSDGEPAGGGDRSFAPVDGLPATGTGFLGLSFAFGERFTLSLAHYIPYSDSYLDDDATAYHARGGYLFAAVTGLSLAVRASKRLYFGFGFNLLNPEFDLRFDYDAGLATCGAPPCNVEDPANVRRLRIRSLDSAEQEILGTLDNPGIFYSFGLLVNLFQTWIGVSYQSIPLSDGDHLSRAASATVTGPAGEVSGSARLDFRLPGMLAIGVRRQLRGGWEVLGSFRWIDYSGHDELDLRLIGDDLRNAGLPEWMPRFRGFQDVFAIDAGAELTPSNRVRLGGKLRFETSAVSEEAVTVFQLDAPKGGLTLGAELRLANTVALTVGYALDLYLPRGVTDSAFKPSSQIACTQSGYDLDTCEDARRGRALPTAAGDYSRVSHQISVGLSYDAW